MNLEIQYDEETIRKLKVIADAEKLYVELYKKKNGCLDNNFYRDNMTINRLEHLEKKIKDKAMPISISIGGQLFPL